jgi:hypothetical protein
MEKIQIDHKHQYFPNLNSFRGKALIGLPSMKLLIQLRHGMKYNGLLLIDLVRFIAKEKWL